MAVMKRTIQIHPNKCMGCHSCELACSFKNEGVFNPIFSRIFVKVDKEFHSPLTCFQCEDAWCDKACTKHAIHRNPYSGALEVDKELCVGCKICTIKCPFGLIVMNQHKQAIKCDLCGGNPECVNACTYGALSYSAYDKSAKEKRDKIFEHLKKSQASLVLQLNDLN